MFIFVFNEKSKVSHYFSHNLKKSHTFLLHQQCLLIGNKILQVRINSITERKILNILDRIPKHNWLG